MVIQLLIEEITTNMIAETKFGIRWYITYSKLPPQSLAYITITVPYLPHFTSYNTCQCKPPVIPIITDMLITSSA